MKIDFHTHPFMVQELMEKDPQLEEAVRNIYGLLFPPQPLEIFIREMDEAGTDRCVLLPIDCTTAHGCKIVSNEAIADLVRQSSRFIGFASVDPHLKTSVPDLASAISGLGLKGLKLDPAIQKFELDSQEFAYPLYEKCAQLGIPVLIHTGMNWSPTALSMECHPLNLEPAVAAFSDTNFILAHLGWPWVNEASLLAMKYPNVFLDTSVVYSGTPSECLQHVVCGSMGKDLFERNLVHKVVYGSNYPRTDMRRSVRGIESLGFSGYLKSYLFEKTARKLLAI